MTTSLARVNIAYFLLSSAVFVRFSAYKYVEDGGIMLELIFSRKKNAFLCYREAGKT